MGKGHWAMGETLLCLLLVLLLLLLLMLVVISFCFCCCLLFFAASIACTLDNIFQFTRPRVDFAIPPPN